MKPRKNDSESGFTLIEVIITLVILAIVGGMMAAYFGKSFTQSSIPIFRLNAAGKLNEIMEKITADYNNVPATWSQNTLYAASTSPAPPTVILPTALNNKKGYQYICTTGGTSGSTEPAWPLSGTVTDGGVIWTYSGLTPRNWVAGFYYTVNAVVYPKNGNGYQYICTTAGTSGTVATEPTWPLSGTVIETTGVQWSYRGPQPTLALQTRIGNEGSEYTNQTFGGDPQVKYRVIHNRFITFVSNTERSTVVAPGEDDYGKYLKVTIGLHSNDAPRTDETLTTLFVRR